MTPGRIPCRASRTWWSAWPASTWPGVTTRSWRLPRCGAWRPTSGPITSVSATASRRGSRRPSGTASPRASSRVRTRRTPPGPSPPCAWRSRPGTGRTAPRPPTRWWPAIWGSPAAWSAPRRPRPPGPPERAPNDAAGAAPCPADPAPPPAHRAAIAPRPSPPPCPERCALPPAPQPRRGTSTRCARGRSPRTRRSARRPRERATTRSPSAWPVRPPGAAPPRHGGSASGRTATAGPGDRPRPRPRPRPPRPRRCSRGPRRPGRATARPRGPPGSGSRPPRAGGPSPRAPPSSRCTAAPGADRAERTSGRRRAPAGRSRRSRGPPNSGPALIADHRRGAPRPARRGGVRANGSATCRAGRRGRSRRAGGGRCPRCDRSSAPARRPASRLSAQDLPVLQPLVQRLRLGEDAHAFAQRGDVGVLAAGQCGADDVGDLAELLGPESAGGQRRGPDPQARGDHRRARIERHGVAVDRDPHLVQEVLRLLAVQLRVPQVHQHEVDVGAAGEDGDARVRAVLLGQPLREDPSALHRPLLALTELLGAGDLHGGGLGRDRVHERAALLPREDGGVELLEQLEVV